MRQLIFCLLLSIFSIGAYSQKQDLNLQGAWKLVVVQEIENGKIVTYFPGREKTEQINVWAGNQIFFVGQTKTSKTTKEDYGIGTFKLNGNNLEETLSGSSYKEAINKKLRFRVEMKGDTLVQTFFLNENFEPYEETQHIEKYLKIK
jgi:hypothetical protein